MKQLTEALHRQFPEAVAALKAKKPIKKSMQQEIAFFVAGFGQGLRAVGAEIPAIVIINLSCGRCDRLFEVK